MADTSTPQPRAAICSRTCKSPVIPLACASAHRASWGAFSTHARDSCVGSGCPSAESPRAL
eukprot:3733418-Prymnesium_polylepis.1